MFTSDVYVACMCVCMCMFACVCICMGVNWDFFTRGLIENGILIKLDQRYVIFIPEIKVLIGGEKKEKALSYLVHYVKDVLVLHIFFLLFAEAMHAFLILEGVQLGGLRLPLVNKTMIDVEFADDTEIYLKTNLQTAESYFLFRIRLSC